MLDRPLSVTQLTQLVKRLLEEKFLGIIVQGEISNFKPHSAGHFYFDLKDNGARIACVMFRAENSHLTRLPKDGDQVILKGSVTVYPPHGKYQMVVKEMQFAGLGELLIKLHELKAKLQAKGWFSHENKKPLPKFPKVIGVVTSPTGAVIRDIIQVLTRRHAGFHLLLNPVRVQGNEAAAEIAKAIEDFNTYQLADVLIVGRGGGSIEDLWPFNEEIVAEAIFKSRIPIISAVGHETDVCIADFVADVRAPTPSAAAEMAIAEKSQQVQFLLKSKQQTIQIISQLLKRHRQGLNAILKHPVFLFSTHLLGPYFQRVDEVEKNLNDKIKLYLHQRLLLLTSFKKQLVALNPKTQFNFNKQKLKNFDKQLDHCVLHKIDMTKERLNKIRSQLESLNPKKVLKRGYSILFSENEGSVIVSTKDLTPKQKVSALLSDGKVSLTVNAIIHE